MKGKKQYRNGVFIQSLPCVKEVAGKVLSTENRRSCDLEVCIDLIFLSLYQTVSPKQSGSGESGETIPNNTAELQHEDKETIQKWCLIQPAPV